MSTRGSMPLFAPLLLALLLGACSEKDEAQPADAVVLEPADMILYNGNVITVDENFSRAQAVAITGDTLTAVGDNEKVLQLQGDGTRVIDLRGASGSPSCSRER